MPIYKKADKRDCSNYRGISLFSAAYKILSFILSRLTPNVEKINGSHQCGFGCKRPTADHILCIGQILKRERERERERQRERERERKYSEVVPQLFIDFKKACMCFSREGGLV